MKNIIILSHNDSDGYGTNIIASVIEKYNSNLKFHIKNCSYKSVNLFGYRALKGEEEYKDLNIPNCDLFLLTDITMSDKMMEWLHKVRNNKAWCLDHHFSTKSYLNDMYSWVKEQELDEDGERTCGTLMFYKFAKAEGWLDTIPESKLKVLEKLVYTIRDYDLWIWKSENNIKPKQLNNLFSFFRADRFVKSCVESIENETDILEINKDNLDFIQESYNIYKESKKHKIRESELLNSTFGMRFGYLYSEHYVSELANDLITECNYDAFAIINMDDGTVSFRSKEGIDVGKVAKELGGNGHFNSSGAIIQSETLSDKIIKEILKQRVEVL